MAQLFEEHDRSRFEVFAFSYGDDDGTPMRRRLEQAFDGFFDVRGLGDDAIASRIREQEIDIMIDLTGHTAGSRLEILASRPAPVQLHYIGHPGTLGVDFIDYLIVDPFVVPPEEQRHYSEALVYLSQCYQANDRRRTPADRRPSRAEAGLPPDGFVFCCFNQTYKITPPLFDAWMRLLHADPDSVLWLLADNRWAEDNLRREAAARGVAPERLVFAPRLAAPEHLARHHLADLFLDTFPYNAHTTASDALWMGLPVLTNAGRGFASRVAGSLLHAVGLPELITQDLGEYERLALALAREPARLVAMRRHLEAVRATAPLFDIDRTRGEIEAAYQQMWEIAQRGEAPRSMVIGARGRSAGAGQQLPQFAKPRFVVAPALDRRAVHRLAGLPHAGGPYRVWIGFVAQARRIPLKATKRNQPPRRRFSLGNHGFVVDLQELLRRHHRPPVRHQT